MLIKKAIKVKDDTMQEQNKPFFIWEGIYESFPEAEQNTSFDSAKWINMQKEECEKLLAKRRARLQQFNEYPLSIVVGFLSGLKKQPLRILDFGGGLGGCYIEMACWDTVQAPIEFFIVESEGICQAGKEMFQDSKQIHFMSRMPDEKECFHIVHAGSSLHYVKNWREILTNFTRYNPTCIVLDGLTAGNIETFCTLQNYYGHKIPVWFWNQDEIISAMADRGFNLVFKSHLLSSYLGKRQPLPMNNFPESNRIQHKLNLIFMPDSDFIK